MPVVAAEAEAQQVRSVVELENPRPENQSAQSAQSSNLEMRLLLAALPYQRVMAARSFDFVVVPQSQISQTKSMQVRRIS